MQTYTVMILPDNKKVEVRKDTLLLEAVRKAGIDLVSPCGGSGTCGKCAVRLAAGAAESEGASHLPQELKASGFITACNTRVTGDMTIEIPAFSRLAGQKVLLSEEGPDGGNRTDFYGGPGMDPMIKKLCITLKRPGPEDSTNDLDRLKTALEKDHGMKEPRIGLGCLRNLPHALRKGNWTVTVTLLFLGDAVEVQRVEPGDRRQTVFGMAADIGTTTVVVNLLDAISGKTVDSAGTYNKQAIYGSDVISRIIFSEEKSDGPALLQKAIADTLNGLVAEILVRNGLDREDIPVMVCAGNTVMTHLLLQVPPDYLRLEPYIPAATDFPAVRAQELGIDIAKDGFMLALPSVASYVGGDITAGVLSTRLHRSEKLTLFIDIGTNGELVLGNSEWMVTCACSAGPAFEGSGITCGMRAMDGAIDRIEIDRESLEVEYRTIGDCEPLGLCGSGLINVLAEMMEAGVIDRAGKILAHAQSARIRKNDEGLAYILVFAGQSGTGKDIAVTEADIKNLLRAKGAIFAGIRTMLQQLQLDAGMIEKVYIAGGFGKHIHMMDAVNIGLLPELPADMYEYVGNSSIKGAVQVLLHREAMGEVREIAARMTYIELSIGNTFMEEFVSAMFIPHTDLRLFPTAGKRG